MVPKELTVFYLENFMKFKLYLVSKRFFDIIFAIICIFLSTPLLFLIAGITAMYSDGPVIYRGERVGLNGSHFYIFKFRTMVPDAEKGSSTTSSNDPRVTPIGRFLRKYKLDELPQFFNVLIGSMSFVGPRPEIPFFVSKYSTEQLEILEAKPGITDLASVYFRNMGDMIEDANPENSYLSRIWKKKNTLRLEYVRNRSFKLDLEIIWRTLLALGRGGK